MPLQVHSSLPDDLESLIQQTIRACLAVHRELGPGLLETVYERALACELELSGIAFECQRSVPILYRGKLLCQQRIDVVVHGRLIVEVKSVERLAPVHVAQILGYLRVTGSRVGLLVNFNVALLKHGLRRVVL